MDTNKFEFNEIKFGNNYRVSSKDITKYEKKIILTCSNYSKCYSNITFFSRKNLRGLI